MRLFLSISCCYSLLYWSRGGSGNVYSGGGGQIGGGTGPSGLNHSFHPPNAVAREVNKSIIMKNPTQSLQVGIIHIISNSACPPGFSQYV